MQGNGSPKPVTVSADQIGISDRTGRGLKVDPAVFNEGTVKDEATFQDPHRYASGIAHVLVYETFAVENGKLTGARPGSVPRKS